MEQDNFIGIYRDAFTPEFCDSIIELHNWLDASGASQGRKNWGHHVKDTQAFTHPTSLSGIGMSLEQLATYRDSFNEIFWKCYNDYCARYSVLLESGKHTILNFKTQRTEQGGGYHVWHFEQDCLARSARLGVYTLYLNTVEEGGETEFLYQGVRFKPEKGTLLIWPAGYTHTHRGNPPLSSEKYILTGWVEYIQ